MNKVKCLIIGMLWCVAMTAAAQVTGEEALQALQEWKAGTTVTLEAVNAYGPERCFAAEEIPDGVWARMQGKTYTENPYIKRCDLRHIRVLHWDYDELPHIGEMNGVLRSQCKASMQAAASVSCIGADPGILR